MTPEDIIKELDLQPHVEGGYFRRMYRNAQGPEGRGHASTIYYLLEGNGFAHRHKLDVDELWFWHAGAPLTLEINAEGETPESLLLGPNVLAAERPQRLVPRNCWQRARSMGEWSLVSCCVTPGFLFETLEMDVDKMDVDT